MVPFCHFAPRFSISGKMARSGSLKIYIAMLNVMEISCPDFIALHLAFRAMQYLLYKTARSKITASAERVSLFALASAS